MHEHMLHMPHAFDDQLTYTCSRKIVLSTTVSTRSICHFGARVPYPIHGPSHYNTYCGEKGNTAIAVVRIMTKAVIHLTTALATTSAPLAPGTNFVVAQLHMVQTCKMMKSHLKS